MNGQQRGRSVVSMQWRDLLFLHWPADPDAVQRLLPPDLSVDTHDGAAWFGLIPFTMPRVRAGGIAWPGATRVHECNVRTYVRCGREDGVWFFTLDANSRLAARAARLGWRLNYRRADITFARGAEEFEYILRRRDHESRLHIAQRNSVSTTPDGAPPMLHCRWEIDRASPPEADPTLVRFLTERYALYTLDRRGWVAIGRIEHEPWSVCRARVTQLEQTLTAAAGLTPLSHIDLAAPLAFHSAGVDARAWPLRPAGAQGPMQPKPAVAQFNRYLPERRQP